MRATIMMVDASGLSKPMARARTMAAAIQTFMSSSTSNSGMRGSITHVV